MRRFFFMSALLILSATTLTAQQSARLGSRQAIRPLPKELVKDGGSYMVLVDCDRSGTDYSVGLYDSFGPEGVKYSFDLPDIQLVRSYYEKVTGGVVESIDTEYGYPYIMDYEKTYTSQSDLELYFNRNWCYLSEHPSIEGLNTFSLDSTMWDRMHGFFWNYNEYGGRYPSVYFVIDGDGHLWLYSVEYSIEGADVQMTVTEKQMFNEEYVCSTIQDVELLFNLDFALNQFKNKIVEFNISQQEKAYYLVRDYFKDFYISHDIEYEEGYEQNYLNESFWKYEKFGMQYPNTIYRINNDGFLEEIHVDYRLERDYSNATWEIDPDYGGSSSIQPNVGQFVYMDVDKSFYPTTPVIISQNLFNDDDNWEYLAFDIQSTPYDTSGVYRDYDYETGTEVERRQIRMRTVCKGIKIMNSEGTQLGYLPVQDKQDEYTVSIKIETVSVLNGLVYILTEEEADNDNHDRYGHYEGIYVIDPKDTSVKTISRTLSRMNLNSTVIDQGERLDIQVSGTGKNDNLTISSMSGQVINSSPVRDDNSISVNTGSMPKGIYNVTLRGNGNPTENQRIIVK